MSDFYFHLISIVFSISSFCTRRQRRPGYIKFPFFERYSSLLYFFILEIIRCVFREEEEEKGKNK